jgi:AcrR family transcriptional regulator
MRVMSTDLGAPDSDLMGKAGRPRSERARLAVLEAVDDLLVEEGYAAMTMKGIAQRAGVGRQTIYRWWSTKAEILLEACSDDAHEELITHPQADGADDLLAYVTVLSDFLTTSPSGLAYCALIGEAQHDPVVRDLVRQADLLAPSAHAVLTRVRPSMPSMPALELASAQLTGPILARVLAGPAPLSVRMLGDHIRCLLTAWRA